MQYAATPLSPAQAQYSCGFQSNRYIKIYIYYFYIFFIRPPLRVPVYLSLLLLLLRLIAQREYHNDEATTWQFGGWR